MYYYFKILSAWNNIRTLEVEDAAKSFSQIVRISLSNYNPENLAQIAQHSSIIFSNLININIIYKYYYYNCVWL